MMEMKVNSFQQFGLPRRFPGHHFLVRLADHRDMAGGQSFWFQRCCCLTVWLVKISLPWFSPICDPRQAASHAPKQEDHFIQLCRNCHDIFSWGNHWCPQTAWTLRHTAVHRLGCQEHQQRRWGLLSTSDVSSKSLQLPSPSVARMEERFGNLFDSSQGKRTRTFRCSAS